MKVCAYCGRQNDDDAKHCRECGSDEFKTPEPVENLAPANALLAGRVDVEFIRLFFPSPEEEEIAFAWAAKLGQLIPEQVQYLRPDTRMSKIMSRFIPAPKRISKPSRGELVEMILRDFMLKEYRKKFIELLENELGDKQSSSVLEDDWTFRELVEFVAKQRKAKSHSS